MTIMGYLQEVVQDLSENASSTRFESYGWQAIYENAKVILVYDFLFLITFVVIFAVSRKRELNFFQRNSLILLVLGVLFRIILLTADLIHVSKTGDHFLAKHSQNVSNSQQSNSVVQFNLEVFIKAPEILFEFPLLAIGLDWLELALILRSKNEFSPEQYLQTNRFLRWVLIGVMGLILGLLLCDLILSSV